MNIEGQTLFALTVTAHMLSVSGADDTRCLLTTLQAPTDTGTGAPGPAWPVTQDRKARGVRSGQSRPEHRSLGQVSFYPSVKSRNMSSKCHQEALI